MKTRAILEFVFWGCALLGVGLMVYRAWTA